MSENINVQPNIVDMAKKMRGVKILKKLKSGEAPTKSEVKELADLQQGQLRPGIVKTQEEVRKAFSVSLRTVQMWVREGMPVKSDGSYDITEIQTWRFIREKRRRERLNTSGDTEKKIKEIKYKRELIELKKIESELISREDVELELIQIFIAIKRRILALRKSLVTMLYGQEKKEIGIILDRELKNVLREFETAKIFDKISYADIKEAKKTTPLDQGTIDMDQ